MKSILIIFISLFSLKSVLSQKESNHWFFGQNAALDFDNCSANSFTNISLNTNEGVSCISNKITGELLFYTNGVDVWSRNNSLMPNGFGLFGHPSNTQVLITPMLGSLEKYYIFTTDLQGFSGPVLCYSIVDMSLNAGYGDVSSKNVPLHNPIVCEKLTATWHSNGIDIWVAAHEYGNNNFLSFQISESGVSSIPVISSIGYNHTGDYDSRGELRFSPNGNKLSNVTNGNSSGVCANELFDFNNTTGVVSNCTSLPNENWGYGTSFSMNNSKLYFTTSPAFISSTSYSKLYQFDLSSDIPSTIINSKSIIDSVHILTESSYESCYLGLDGKIYVARFSKNYLGVINSPNSFATNCSFVRNGFFLNAQLCYSGTNNLISVVETCQLNSVEDNIINGRTLSVYPNPFSNQTILESDILPINATLIIEDCFGKTVKRIGNIFGETISLKRDGLSSGFYFIHLIQDNKVIATKKIIIAD